MFPRFTFRSIENVSEADVTGGTPSAAFEFRITPNARMSSPSR